MPRIDSCKIGTPNNGKTLRRKPVRPSSRPAIVAILAVFCCACAASSSGSNGRSAAQPGNSFLTNGEKSCGQSKSPPIADQGASQLSTNEVKVMREDDQLGIRDAEYVPDYTSSLVVVSTSSDRIARLEKPLSESVAPSLVAPDISLNDASRHIDVARREPARTKWASGITFIDPESGASRAIQLPAGSMVAFPAWSPDGNSLAFIVNRSGKLLLYKASWDSVQSKLVSPRNVNLFVRGQYNKVFNGGGEFVPYVWAPGGEYILFASPTSTISAKDEWVEQFSIQRTLDTDQRRAQEYETLLRLGRTGASNRLADFMYQSELICKPLADNATCDGLGGSGLVFRIDVSPHFSNYALVATVDLGRTSPRAVYRLIDQRSGDSALVDAREVVSSAHVAARVIWTNESTTPLLRIYDEADGYCASTANAQYRRYIKQMCVDGIIARVWKTEDKLFVLTEANRLFTYSRNNGKLLHSIAYLTVPKVSALHRSYSPVKSASLDQIQLIRGGSQILVGVIGADGMQIRELEFIGFDFQSGETERLFWSDNSALHVTSIEGALSEDEVLVHVAMSQGQRDAAILRYTDQEILEIQPPATPAFKTFSDYENVPLTYVREDNVRLSATMYLPQIGTYESNGKFPLLIWQYPSHADDVASFYRDTEDRRQRRSSPIQNLGSVGDWLPLGVLSKGIAILHYPEFPVIGDDSAEHGVTYLEQTQWNAIAAVDAAVATDLVDRKRIAIAGHSYGGGSAALLLASTPLFETAICIAGAMNQVLFPHYLQYEDDAFWRDEGPFLRNSAALHANTLSAPILMIHGEKDMTQARSAVSEGLFHGIATEGGDARLVLLPFADHFLSSPQARERTMVEVVIWLNRLFSANNDQGRSAH